MNIIEIYNAVADKVKPEQNGTLAISSFNIKSKTAELRLLDYISGDVEGIKPPEPYTTLKVKDWLSYFLKTQTGVTEEGRFAKPDDYYMFESMTIIGSYKDENCGEPIVHVGCDTSIELLDSAVYDKRCFTHIKSLKPSIKKPITRIVGNEFEFNPADLGSIKLVYKKYPEYGQVKIKIDPVFNDEVPDPATSIDYEWPEFARGLLTWFICQQYPTGTREAALTQQLAVEAKSVRG